MQIASDHGIMNTVTSVIVIYANMIAILRIWQRVML